MSKEALICSPSEAELAYRQAAEALNLAVEIKKTPDGKAIFVAIPERFEEYLAKLYELAGGSEKFWGQFGPQRGAILPKADKRR